MKSESLVSYRVPTGAEIKAFVECVNLAVKVGYIVTYAQSGAEWRVSRVVVKDFGEPYFEVVTWCGLPLPARNFLLISSDSFAFEARYKPLQKMVPNWMEVSL